MRVDNQGQADEDALGKIWDGLALLNDPKHPAWSGLTDVAGRLKASRIEHSTPDRNAVLEKARTKLLTKLGEGEFYAQGDRFDLVFRPGGGSYAGGDIVVAKMACGETAHWLPGLVATLLNTALTTKPKPGAA